MADLNLIVTHYLLIIRQNKAEGNMNFFTFIVVTAVLFVRPAELVEAISFIPFYNITLSLCLVVSFVPLSKILTAQNVIKNPVTFCMLSITSMICISNVMQMDLYYARVNTVDFLKTLLYYLLLVVTVTTPSRLRLFLSWLVVFTTILTTMALLHHNEVIIITSIPMVTRLIGGAAGTESVIVQLIATGIYSDPNDFCSILAVCIIICLYRLADNRAGFSRVFWFVPLGLFFYAVIMTRSRGGFLGMLAGLMALLVSRFGWQRAVLMCGLMLPPLFLMVGGRSTDFSSEESQGGESTLESRLTFWREGYILLFRHPIFGIGSGKFQDYVGMVAHNSFIHASTEMGLLGGAFFMGVYYLPLWFLWRLRPPNVEIQDLEMRRLRPYLIGILVSSIVSLLSISRCYIVSTYMVPGIAVSYLRIVGRESPDAIPQLSTRLLFQLGLAYLVYLTITYLFVRYKLG